MPRHSFVQMTKLTDVRGRVDYITNPKRQEHLYATYTSVKPEFWKLLSKQSQFDFWRSHQSKGKCIEGRELVIALPEHLQQEDPERLLQEFTKVFQDRYGMQCTSALHHNKAKTNYHIHLVFSERNLLEKPEIKTASRNMFFDEDGRHVRTKKQILDENGNVRPGCVILRKGLPYEMRYFSERKDKFTERSFLPEVKAMYTELINQHARSDLDKVRVFDKSGPYLPTKKIGKNNPKAEEIKADNELRKEWNQSVDQILIAGGSQEDVIEFKRECVTSKVAESVKTNGYQPGLFASVLRKAITVLKEYFIYLMMLQRRKENRTEKGAVDPTGTREPVSVQTPDQKLMAPELEPLIDPALIMSAQAEYMRLQAIQDRLNTLNKKAYAIERDVMKLVTKLNKTSLLHWRQRKELEKTIAVEQTRLNTTRDQIELLPKQYGFNSVSEFVTAYKQAKSDYESLLSQQEERKASNERKLREYEEQMKKEKPHEEPAGSEESVKETEHYEKTERQSKAHSQEQDGNADEPVRTVTPKQPARPATAPTRNMRKKSVLMRLHEKQEVVDEKEKRNHNNLNRTNHRRGEHEL